MKTDNTFTCKHCHLEWKESALKVPICPRLECTMNQTVPKSSHTSKVHVSCSIHGPLDAQIFKSGYGKCACCNKALLRTCTHCCKTISYSNFHKHKCVATSNAIQKQKIVQKSIQKSAIEMHEESLRMQGAQTLLEMLRGKSDNQEQCTIHSLPLAYR